MFAHFICCFRLVSVARNTHGPWEIIFGIVIKLRVTRYFLFFFVFVYTTTRVLPVFLHLELELEYYYFNSFYFGLVWGGVFPFEGHRIVCIRATIDTQRCRSYQGRRRARRRRALPFCCGVVAANPPIPIPVPSILPVIKTKSPNLSKTRTRRRTATGWLEFHSWVDGSREGRMARDGTVESQENISRSSREGTTLVVSCARTTSMPCNSIPRH